MPLIRNLDFRKIFEGLNNIVIPQDYKPQEYPYIGLGNPDANILFVGSEKKEEVNFPQILQHELVYNFVHWCNLINEHSTFNDRFHPGLKLRGNQLDHFNPFSPLSLDETCLAVYKLGNHTYRRIETIINGITLNFNSTPPKSIFAISPKKYEDSIFSKCFLTELSDHPLPAQNGVWDFTGFKNSARGQHILKGSLGKFYRSFKKIVIYAGRSYTGDVGSLQREEIIQMFNPNLTNLDIQVGAYDGVELYQKYVSEKGGAEVVITENHLITAMYNNPFVLGHALGVIGIGEI
jgi:hypothetical protein